MGAKKTFRTFYRERKYYCGEFLDVLIYPVLQEYEDGKKRPNKVGPTKPVQERANNRHSAEKQTRILHKYFTPDDFELGLSYLVNPECKERLLKDLQNYFKRIKRMMVKMGIKQELKYIVVPEVSDRGRYHIHLTISCGLDRDTLESLWGHGWANAKRLQFTTTGLARLAHYKVNEKKKKKTVFFRNWWASRNLKDPKPEDNNSKIRSKRKAMELARDSDDYRFWEVMY